MTKTCKLCNQDFTPKPPKLSALYCDDCRYSKERYAHKPTEEKRSYKLTKKKTSKYD